MKSRRREPRAGNGSKGKRGLGRYPNWILLMLLWVGTPLPAQQSGYSSIPQKIKTRGVIMERFSDGFILREYRGTEMAVDLTGVTEIKEEKKNFLRAALEYSPGHLVPGLDVQVEGTHSSGRILAEKIKFTQDALEVARTITSRVEPIEAELAETHSRLGMLDTRLGKSEDLGQQLSGEVEELESAVKLNRSQMKAVEGKAEQALSGVQATNRRVDLLDQYETSDVLTIRFPFNSADISDQARAQLDALAGKLSGKMGFLVEIQGFSSSDGDVLHNRFLSQKRADQVRAYLVKQHQVSMRRFVSPFGYGTENPVADESTLEGRQANRRVEVRVLVSPGFKEWDGPVEVAKAPNPFRP